MNQKKNEISFEVQRTQHKQQTSTKASTKHIPNILADLARMHYTNKNLATLYEHIYHCESVVSGTEERKIKIH